MNSSKKSLLFSPIAIRGVTLKNRIGVSPMSQYSCEDGVLSDWHFVHYGSFAAGGAGLVMIESTAVTADGRITHGCPELWKDEQIEPFRRLTKFIKSQESVAGVQLAHAGRKASTVVSWIGRNSIADEDGGWPTIGPSPIQYGDHIWKVPKEATVEDIEQIKNSWVSAAKRAVKAGFEVIELHFAHGYLVNSFLSPIANKRTDKYGGSLENRMRFGLEIADNVRKALPQNIVLGVRVSVTDFVDNGWDVKQSTEFAEKLKKIGIDFIDCIAGGVVSTVKFDGLTVTEPQLKAAETIQKAVGIPTVAVGKIVDPMVAENILKSNSATLIFIGRGFLNNPHWPYMAADVLTDEQSFRYPDQYDWCIGWRGIGKWRTHILNAQND